MSKSQQPLTSNAATILLAGIVRGLPGGHRLVEVTQREGWHEVVTTRGVRLAFVFESDADHSLERLQNFYAPYQRPGKFDIIKIPGGNGVCYVHRIVDAARANYRVS